MIKKTWKLAGAAVLSATFATGAMAADKGDTNKSGMYESGDRGVKAPSSGGNDAAQRVPQAGSGVSTIPSKNMPASVSESSPQTTGKEVAAKKVPDDKRMGNPKTPASPNESASGKGRSQ